MLVLSRKKDQAIVIGEQITVSIIDIQGDNVRIGISAPLDIRIYRQEIYDEIQEENRKAAENLDKLKKQVQNLKDYKNHKISLEMKPLPRITRIKDRIGERMIDRGG